MLTPEQQLRLLVGERIPPGGSETDTLFSNEELSIILNRHNDEFNSAAAEAWAIKAAEFAVLIDVSEEGSERRLSQRYRHAMLQLDYYSNLVQADKDALLEVARRGVVARSAAWATPASDELPRDSQSVESSPWDSGRPAHVRPYPLHRFNQIKR